MHAAAPIIATLFAFMACGGGQSPTVSEPAPKPSSRPAEASPAAEGPVNPDGPGKLAMSEVDAHMDNVRASIRACAEATTYEGKVSVRVTITPEGSASAVIESGSGDPTIDQCMLDAFAAETFPTSERGQRFAYSYTF